MKRLLSVLVGIVLLAVPVLGGEVLYSYRAGELGGLARVVVDDATGEVVSHERLHEDERLAQAHKIAIDRERGLAVVVNESEAAPVAWIVTLDGEREPVAVMLPAMPDAVCIMDGVAHIGLDDGSLVAVDLESGSIVASFDTRKQLTPPGQKPESITAVASRGVLLVSMQKDHKGGKRFGNRILVLRERTLELVADVRLPRTMPELHNAESRKEQGPGPEVIAVCEETGSVLITIDFYGALLPVKLDDLMDGHTGDGAYRSAAVDGSFGDAFPDRLVTLSPETTQRAVVLNSGTDGGGVLIDFATGEVLSRFEVPFGLEPVAPIFDGSVATVFATHAGKMKVRSSPEVEKTYHPSATITRLTIDGDRVSAQHLPAPDLTHLAVIATGAEDRLIVLMGASRDRLGLFDIEELAFDRDLIEAFGRVERVVRRR